MTWLCGWSLSVKARSSLVVSPFQSVPEEFALYLILQLCQNSRLSHSWPRNVPFLSPSSICTSVHPSLTHTFPFSLALFLFSFLKSIAFLPCFSNINLSPQIIKSLALLQFVIPPPLLFVLKRHVEKKWMFYQG